MRRYASLIARDQDQDNTRQIVLPTGAFFPDEFDGDAGSVNLLFWRLQEHSALTDVDVELRFLDDGGGGASAPGCGSCSTSGCGPGKGNSAPAPVPPIARLKDAYRVDVLMSQARTPVTLTAYLATALARVYIEENGGLEEFPPGEWRTTCELSAVSLGFGVLLANASHMFSKGCGGVRVDRATALSVTETVLALALFAALGEKAPSSFTAALDPTQRSAWSEAKLWTDSNQKLIRRIRRDPSEVARDDMLDIQEAKPWLARVLGIGGKKKRTAVFDEDELSQFESQMKTRANGSSKKKMSDPRADELRALVDESLEGVRAAREQALRQTQSSR